MTRWLIGLGLALVACGGKPRPGSRPPCVIGFEPRIESRADGAAKVRIDFVRRVPKGTITQPLVVDDDRLLGDLAQAIEKGDSLEVVLVERAPDRWRVHRFGMMSFGPTCPGE